MRTWRGKEEVSEIGHLNKVTLVPEELVAVDTEGKVLNLIGGNESLTKITGKVGSHLRVRSLTKGRNYGKGTSTCGTGTGNQEEGEGRIMAGIGTKLGDQENQGLVKRILEGAREGEGALRLDLLDLQPVLTDLFKALHLTQSCVLGICRMNRHQRSPSHCCLNMNFFTLDRGVATHL